MQAKYYIKESSAKQGKDTVENSFSFKLGKYHTHACCLILLGKTESSKLFLSRTYYGVFYRLSWIYCIYSKTNILVFKYIQDFLFITCSAFVYILIRIKTSFGIYLSIWLV